MNVGARVKLNVACRLVPLFKRLAAASRRNLTVSVGTPLAPATVPLNGRGSTKTGLVSVSVSEPGPTGKAAVSLTTPGSKPLKTPACVGTPRLVVSTLQKGAGIPCVVTFAFAASKYANVYWLDPPDTTVSRPDTLIARGNVATRIVSAKFPAVATMQAEPYVMALM